MMTKLGWILTSVALWISAEISAHGQALRAPTSGHYVHGCYPGGISGEEDDLTLRDVQSYEETVGQKAAWVYFSNNWYASRKFPLKTARWIRDHGSIPYIRLMLRSKNHEIGKPEKFFTLQAILEGRFDADLKAWGRDAAAFGTPLIVEYGTEVNGEWFGWNGKFHGAGRKDGFGDPEKADGPERFVAAYRHLVDVIRSAGAARITWVFHLDASESPDIEWNQFENYYPGSGYVNWIGVSCYGPQTPIEEPEEISDFRSRFDPVYARISHLAPDKPIMIVEFGCTTGYPYLKAEDWAGPVLDDILSNRWPQVRGFSWWNERWENDDDPSHNTTMRVQDNPALARVFRAQLKKHASSLVRLSEKSASPTQVHAANR